MEQHTGKAVRHPHILAIVLTQEHANNSPLGLVVWYGSVVMIDGGEEDEGCDGDVSGD